MGIRDVILLLVLLLLVPLALARPWIGALVWVWISIMSPHRMTYWMYDAPVALIVAVALILGLFLTRDHRHIPMAPPIFWMIIFTVWMVVTFPFSFDTGPEGQAQLEKVLKIMLLNLLVLMPLHTRRHVDLLIGVLALSIGFFGLKGGIFAIMTGGAYQVRGGGGFIEPNNELALALLMSVPLLYYLMLQCKHRVLRWGFVVLMFLSTVAAVASQSRGALIALIAMAGAFLLRSPSRARLVLPMLATGVFIAAFMPSTWWERMDTVRTYDSDASAQGRINAWILAWRVAKDHFLGGGFNLETPEVFSRYAPNADFIAVAHSIYFQVLGHHGFVGLFIYLMMWFATIRTGFWIYRNSSTLADRQLARMAEISLVGFAVGGAFLSLAYFDGPFYIMIALVVLRYKVLGNRTLRGEPSTAAASADDDGAKPNQALAP